MRKKKCGVIVSALEQACLTLENIFTARFRGLDHTHFIDSLTTYRPSEKSPTGIVIEEEKDGKRGITRGGSRVMGSAHG